MENKINYDVDIMNIEQITKPMIEFGSNMIWFILSGLSFVAGLLVYHLGVWGIIEMQPFVEIQKFVYLSIALAIAGICTGVSRS